MGSWCSGGNTVNKTESYSANPLTTQLAGGVFNQYGNLPGPGGVPLQGISQNNPFQTSAFQGLYDLGANNPANPMFSAASNLVQQGSTPLDMNAVMGLQGQLANPLLANYSDQMGRMNAQNNAGMVASAGGTDASRIGVGQSEFAKQAGLGAGQIGSGALQQAIQYYMQQKQMEQAGGSLLGSMAPSVLGTNIGGWQAALGAGNQQQQQQQNILNSLFNQQTGAYQNPFQVTGLGGSLLGSMSGALGGTKSGTTTYPPTSPIPGIAGLGIAGVGAYNALSPSFAPQTQQAQQSWRGGAVNPMANGGIASNAPGNPDSFWDSMDQRPQQQSNNPLSGISQFLSMGKTAGLFGGQGGAGAGAGAGAAEGEAAPLGLAGDYGGAEAASPGLMSGIGDWFSGLGAGAGEFLSSLGPEAALVALAKDGGPVRALGGSVSPMDAGRGYADVSPDDIDDPNSSYNRNLLPRRPLIEGNLQDSDLSFPSPDSGKVVTIPRGDYGPFTRPRPPGSALPYAGDGEGDPPSASPSPGGGADSGVPTPPALSRFAQPGASARLAQNPWMALVHAGLGMAAASGARDQHGLPVGGSPMGQLINSAGKGGLEGVKNLQEQQTADLRQRQMEAQLAQHQYEMQMKGLPYKMETAAQRRQHDIQAQVQLENARHHGVLEEQGNYVYYPGTKLNDETGQLEQGIWSFDKKTNSSLFRPNSSIQSPSLGPVVIPGGTSNLPGTTSGPLIQGVDPPAPDAIGGMSGDNIVLQGTNYASSGKLPPGMSSSRNPTIMAQRAAVMNYGTALLKSRGVTPQEASDMWLYRPRHAGWLMGADGRAAGALGTLVDHLDTARDLFKALHNGDMQLFNRVKNKFREQFGEEAPTNVSAASQIVGAEVLKAIGVQGAGGEAERAAASSALGNLGLGPKQSEGAIDTVQRLAAGQLRTKQRQASAIGLPEERIKNLVGARAWGLLGSLPDSGTTTTRSPEDKAALDWAAKNPKDPRAVEIKKRLGVE